MIYYNIRLINPGGELMVIDYKILMDKLIHKNLKRKADEQEIKQLSKLQMWYFNTELNKKRSGMNERV